MDAYEIGYLAGLIDGEGHIGIRWHHGGNKYYAVAAIVVSSTDLAVLQWCSQVTGKGRVRYTMNQSPLARKEQYKWHVSRYTHVLDILRLVVFHMKIKRDIAENMIEELEQYTGPTPRAGYSTVSQRQLHVRRNGYALDGHTHV